jgi:hypothetical protein
MNQHESIDKTAMSNRKIMEHHPAVGSILGYPRADMQWPAAAA